MDDLAELVGVGREGVLEAAEADDEDSRLGLGPKNSRWALITN